ncbi:phosphoserine phosphatase SerB [Zavarzinia compransoris]|uniref:Phosphoserine phosphatase n=1 Tax=Zavarzinia compransoris TaxID=1264899 RepID=A0A317E9U2_9PROT|nr:phosphoserine phosphatase SerB [Zavarzinia compransoris]PWR21895.1 phosphoserine phosphatase SerB [Zavarzinia compransoris]TDP47376.1 phosphoserine phosphatase [Zavarzinia compransoris]
MNHVLTVIGNPAQGPIDDAALADLALALQQAGAAVGEADWLAPGEAADLPFDGIAPLAAEAIADIALSGLAVDRLAQAVAGRARQLLIADMDSTMITVECIDELADFAGLKAEIAAVTERAMRGELDFETALRERVARLKGLSEGVLQTCFDERVRFTPGARALVQTMAANGAHCALVSGGFTFFTARVAAHLGFHENRANILHVAGGALTGTVAEPIVGASAKLESLRALSARLGLRPEQSLAVGDGANDLPMIEAAGLGVAFHAKPKVAAAARARVNVGDLTALLYFQGYRKADFIA